MGKKNKYPLESTLQWLGTNAGKFVALGTLLGFGFVAGVKFTQYDKNQEIGDLKNDYRSEITELKFEIQRQKLLIQNLQYKITNYESKKE